MRIGAISSVTSTIPVRPAEYKPAANRVQPDAKVDAAKEVPGQAPAAADDKKEKWEGEERELENLAAVSEDGDTVQVSPESNDRLELDKFGKVTAQDGQEKESVAEAQQRETEKKAEAKKAEERKEEIRELMQETIRKAERKSEELKNFDVHRQDDKKADKKAENREKQSDEVNQESVAQPASTVGRTESQIKQMYLDGSISKNEYDRAIKIREERKDNVQEKDAEFTKETAKNVGELNRTKQDETELKELFDEDASGTVAAATRAEILSSLQDFAINEN